MSKRDYNLFYPSVPDDIKPDLSGCSPLIKTKTRELEAQFSSEDRKMIEKLDENSRSIISVNQEFDLISMLISGTKDDYLVRPDGTTVRVDCIKSKYILVWCTFVPVLWSDAGCHRALSNLLSDVQFDCEMVIVVKMREKWEKPEVFSHFLSGFQDRCLAVPFEHPSRRDSLCKKLGFTGSMTGVFLDPSQVVLQNNLLDNFVNMGAWPDIFPFTDNMFAAARKKNSLLLKSCLIWDPKAPGRLPLLRYLLGLSPGDCLQRYSSSSSSIGREEGVSDSISISELENKHVGLYLCCSGDLLEEVHKVYQECQRKLRAFELVLVYCPGAFGWSSKLFMDLINRKLNDLKISWWVLPYNDTISRRLWYLCDLLCTDKLIMVGSKGSFLDTHGHDMMTSIGSDGYPFSRDYFRKDKCEWLRSLTLQSFLVSSDNKLYRQRRPFPLSYLKGQGCLPCSGLEFAQ